MNFIYEETIEQMLKEFCILNNLDVNNLDDRIAFYLLLADSIDNKIVA